MIYSDFDKEIEMFCDLLVVVFEKALSGLSEKNYTC